MSNLTVASVGRQFDMNGMHLVEASAGTGKTYSIQTLYLRYVLAANLTVEQILVVTFTNAATKELRERLQKVLRDAILYLDKIDADSLYHSPDPEDRIEKLIRLAMVRPEETTTIRLRIQQALLDFDLAAIYTIHGFCQRVLGRFAFETKQQFDMDPTGDSTEEIDELCRDWWRRHIYAADEKTALFISQSKAFTLATITEVARKRIAKPDAVLIPDPIDLGELNGTVQNVIHDFTVAHPSTELERMNESEWAQAPDGAKKAITGIRTKLAEFRNAVAQKDSSTAAAKFLEAGAISHEEPLRVPDSVKTLSAKCAAFIAIRDEQKHKHNCRKTVSANFEFASDGALSYPRFDAFAFAPVCGEIVNIAKQAARELQSLVENGIKKYVLKNLNTAQTLYDAVLTLGKYAAGEPSLKAADIYKAIEALAGNHENILKKSVSYGFDDLVPEAKSAQASLAGMACQCICGAVRDIAKSYEDRRSVTSTLSFNDILLNLRAALKADGSSDKLKAVLRAEFQAALIDEFQDTDPVQWDIFNLIFSGNHGKGCFLVGDPKQAIYRFRNGDIETYIEATKGLTSRYELTENRRAEKRLIDAVNQLFLDRGGKPTFQNTAILYQRPLAAYGKKAGERLTIDPARAQEDPKPFKVLLIPNSSEKSVPGKNSWSARMAYRLTAAEIASLLSNEQVRIGRDPVRKNQIAVLVNKHDEGEYIARELQKIGIASVRQGTGSVWDTEEGKTFWIFMEAILDPQDLSNVRRALINPWIGISSAGIERLNNGDKVDAPALGDGQSCTMADWVVLLEKFRDTWVKRGFPAMFRQMTGTLGLKRRLVAGPLGQRRWANLVHLSELAGNILLEGRKTPEGMLAWMRRQFDPATADGGDAVKLRLETDDNAVRILTIFASKGLQFPIVFAPTLFMMKSPWKWLGCLYEYHEGDKYILALSDSKDKGKKSAESKEFCAEQVRQIYVALTRAIHRTVVVALCDGKGLLSKDVLRLPLKDSEDQGKQVDLETVETTFGNIPGVPCAVEVSSGLMAQRQVQNKDYFEIKAPGQKPRVDNSMGHGSFSSLAPQSGEEIQPADGKDRDGATGETGNGPAVKEKPEGIFAFPAGAKTGTCWHEIFEEIDFAADEEKMRAISEEKLQAYGFLRNADKKQERIEVTAVMVGNVLSQPLPWLIKEETPAPFSLSAVGLVDRKPEWEFSFPALSRKCTDQVRQIIDKYPDYKPFTDALGKWDRDIPAGYMTGFLDLLFRHGERYYIADWKSNRRGGRQDDFNAEGLRSEMASHGYWLQYLIYCVAVHQHLVKALPGYDYEKNFGGVYYVFLRGVNGEGDGVYADRPPLDLIRELSGILGDFT